MRTKGFADAIDEVLADAMSSDPRIIVMGEDVHAFRDGLFIRFGGKRVISTPISESAFLGAAVTAAMAGLRPVVEIMLVDFIGVAIDALLNHAAKLETFSGGNWSAPMVVRASCGGGYGDGGQHQQTLWGWLAHIPGLVVVVPSTPADAGGLMLSAIQYDGPVVYLEHKLLADYWLENMGGAWRKGVQFDVPAAGAMGIVPEKWQPVPIGQAVVRQQGDDLTMVGVGVGVHRALEAAGELAEQGIYASVIDLRTITPLDKDTICGSVARSGRLLVVDEDYEGFGLSGEVAAVALEANLSFTFGRVCTRETIPYARHLEDRTLPNRQRIVEKALHMLEKGSATRGR